MEHISVNQNFPRHARLVRAREFEQVLRRPDVRLRFGPLRLNAVFNRMHCARLGLIVGKKAVARASARNRIKRVIRDRFRKVRFDLPDLDLVVRVVGPLTRAQLHLQLDRLFEELGDLEMPETVEVPETAEVPGTVEVPGSRGPS